MNAAHWHLVLNHLPVVGLPVCALLLAAALAMWSRDVTVVALGMCLVVSIMGVAAFLSGEPAEEMIEEMAGVSESAIEAHEEAAEVALWFVGILGAAALAGLGMALVRRGNVPRSIVWIALVTALSGSAVLAWTANLGGKIRHPEIAMSETRQTGPASDAITTSWISTPPAATRPS
jgi:hypothetical protein